MERGPEIELPAVGEGVAVGVGHRRVGPGAVAAGAGADELRGVVDEDGGVVAGAAGTVLGEAAVLDEVAEEGLLGVGALVVGLAAGGEVERVLVDADAVGGGAARAVVDDDGPADLADRGVLLVGSGLERGGREPVVVEVSGGTVFSGGDADGEGGHLVGRGLHSVLEPVVLEGVGKTVAVEVAEGIRPDGVESVDGTLARNGVVVRVGGEVLDGGVALVGHRHDRGEVGAGHAHGVGRAKVLGVSEPAEGIGALLEFGAEGDRRAGTDLGLALADAVGSPVDADGVDDAEGGVLRDAAVLGQAGPVGGGVGVERDGVLDDDRVVADRRGVAVGHRDIDEAEAAVRSGARPRIGEDGVRIGRGGAGEGPAIGQVVLVGGAVGRSDRGDRERNGLVLEDGGAPGGRVLGIRAGQNPGRDVRDHQVEEGVVVVAVRVGDRKAAAVGPVEAVDGERAAVAGGNAHGRREGHLSVVVRLVAGDLERRGRGNVRTEAELDEAGVGLGHDDVAIGIIGEGDAAGRGGSGDDDVELNGGGRGIGRHLHGDRRIAGRLRNEVECRDIRGPGRIGLRILEERDGGG